MEQSNSSISVVLPTHNRLDLLEKAVHSIYAQTLMPLELIVVDDGSVPMVTDKIFTDAPKGLKTLLLRHDSPMGAPEARNSGIRKALGKWVAFLDDDDAFFPEKIEMVNRYIANNPDVDLIYHPAKIHMVGLNVVYYSKPQPINTLDNAFELIYKKNQIGGTSMTIVKKQSMIDVGLFSKHLPALEDLELWLKLAKVRASFLLLDKPLTHYHFYTGKKSITKNIEARDRAMVLINEAFKEEITALELINEEDSSARYLKSNVFIALINMQKKEALIQQMKLFRHTMRINDFLPLLVIPFGSKWVFKLRSYL